MPLYKTLNKFSRKPDSMEMATSCLFTGISFKLKETNTFIYLFFFCLFYWANLPRGKEHEQDSGPLRGAPPYTIQKDQRDRPQLRPQQFIKHNRLNQLTIYKHDGGADRFPLGSFSCSITDHVMILLGIPAFKFSNSRAQNL